MQLCIFEDMYYDRLSPLTLARTTYDLVCGINSIRAKILRAYPDSRYSLHCRQYLEQEVKAKNPNIPVNFVEDHECLFINGRILAPSNMAEIIPIGSKENRLYMNGETIVAARVSGTKLDELKRNLFDLYSMADFEGLQKEEVDIRHIDFAWDLINSNHEELQNDFDYLMSQKERGLFGKIYEGVHILEKDNVYIGPGAQIKPGVVIDASEGPVYIDEDATLFPNSVIENSVYIGRSSQVKSCARLHDNVSIGRVCKVGGELEDSIILPFSNKQHSGFLGHAYLGSWINIGADTNNSDLKNNYGLARAYVNGELTETGSQFLGVIMGDHSKTSINTMFNTASVVGFSCNLFGAGFPSKNLPSFSWGGSGMMTTYELERSIETARRAMLRRNHEMEDYEEKLFRKIFDLTKKERRKLGYPY